jgi:transcription antitermination factor NusG
MDVMEIEADLRWYVNYTNPKQEQKAKSNLMTWGVETLNPNIKKRRLSPSMNIPTYETAPLLPRCIFARFCADESLLAVKINEAGFAGIGEEFKVGNGLPIQAGPLKELVGVFERGMKDSERVSLQLDAVNYQSHPII